MNILTPEQKAKLIQLISENGWDDLDPDSVANKMNQARATVLTGQTQPKPFTWDQMLACVTPENAIKILSLPALPTIIDRAEAQDRTALAQWLKSLAYTGLVTSQEAQAIAEIVNANEDAPDAVIHRPSVFDEAFPGFSCVFERQAYRFMPNGQYEKDEQGNDLLFTERIPYERCFGELVIEARS